MNRKQAQKRTERLQRQQVRFQERQHYYMRNKHKPHAQKRMGLLAILLSDIGQAMMQAMGMQQRRSHRFLDYNRRFLSPYNKPRGIFLENTRSMGRTRER